MRPGGALALAALLGCARSDGVELSPFAETLVVEPQSIDLGGPGVLSRATASVVRRFVTIEHAIEGLPEGLVLLEVDVRDDGFRADLEGDDVVLVEGSGS